VTLSAETAAASLDRDRLVERLARLVRTDSQNPPGNEAAAGDLVASFCSDLGLDVAVHEAVAGRPNVVARLGSGRTGDVVAYCSHIDTVPIGPRSSWTHEPLGAEAADGKLWGRGACDAKGPVAAALEAVSILRSAKVGLSGALELELVSDEETMGFKGAGYLLEEGIVAPTAVIVGEPTSLRLVRAQRGACWLALTVTGRAAHGSAPERGVNAIVNMAEVVRHIQDTLPDLSHEVLGGPSINVGTIAGGEKVNMVPGSCSIEIDRRTLPGETAADVVAQVREAVERARCALGDIEADLEISFAARPFEVDVGAPVVAEMAAALEDATGAPAELVGFRGASDARFFAEEGTDVVVCGPGDIALAHTVREHIDLTELERAAVAYALAFSRLLGADHDG
jgi:succinyl-diaminopimelate desuccinylase